MSLPCKEKIRRRRKSAPNRNNNLICINQAKITTKQVCVEQAVRARTFVTTFAENIKLLL